MSVGRLARSACALTLSILLVVGFLAGIVPSAQAATSGPPPVVDNPSNAVTGDALPTAQINGVAWDQAIVGTTVYVAGQFTSARPAGAAAGTGESPRQNLMSYNLTTGVMTSWAPQVNGRIRVVTASPDGSRIYIGGSFSQVNGQPRSRVAAFNTSDGSLVATFAPSAGSDVFGITATNSAVYMGGWFTTMNGVARTRLAAVSASNGALLAWAPTADFTVYGLGLTAAQDRVVVSGSFSNLNGEPATSLGSLDAVTGTSYPFAANQVVHNVGNTASMIALKVVDDKAYSSGYWYGGTGNFEGGLIMDPYNGTILNMANCLGDTYDIAPMNGLYYMVSHHHQCTDSGGFPEFTPRIWQATDAFTIEPTGTVQPNTYGYPNFAGHPSGSSVNWFPTMVPGGASGAQQAGWTVESQGNYLAVGGEFIRVNNQNQQGLVRFGTRTVVAKPSLGPAANFNETAPRLDALSATSVRVRFQSDFDRDGRTLTYKVIRSDLGANAPVFTTTGESSFWDRPWLQFIDTGLVAGRQYSYRVVATDADGNTRTGGATLITAGSDVPDASAYATQVAADGASHYWRLREPAGSSYSVDHGTAGSDLNLRAGVTLGGPGAITGSPDAAATTNGSETGFGVSSTLESAPDVFSAEVWFRTTTTSGGKILGFGNASSGQSGSYDRHLYMNDAGQLTFGVHPGSVRALTSPKAYNDGVWHHAVATLSPNGMTLHVDGLRIGADAGTTSGQPYAGYWRVGGDSQGGWPNAGSSNYFAGDIDDAAIYPTALTQAQIRDHYTRSGRTVAVPPPPADAYGQAVSTDEPLFFWRLDDSTATAEDATGNGATGTYRNGPLQGVASPVTTVGRASAFDGSDDLVSSNVAYANPTVFSIESWFNTTSTLGGKVIGFGRAQDGNSGSYDRHVYLDGAGKVNFGTYTGQTNVIQSADSYNDGQWHHMVATLGPSGMALYLDGVLQGTNASTGAENYTGYWRVGGDNTWAGNPYLAGTIDEVAVYGTVLDAQRVREHYQASPAARNAAPVAAIESSCSGLSCALTAIATDPDGTISTLSWDFGDGSTATGSPVTHAYAAAGTYTITLTATDNAGATTTATRTVTVREPLPAPTDAYGVRVMADDPLLYWRLGETSGAVAQDQSRYVHPGSYQESVTLGQPAVVAPQNSSALFSGEGRAVSQDRFASPTSFGMEAWFNTTNSGARIIGFGSEQSGRSNYYDRHVYLDSEGRAVFGVWAPGGQTITSPAALNDGRWHHVVAGMDASGMSFYVDGDLVGTNPNSSVDPYDGYWRVGADNIWDGNGAANALIDEAAVYAQPLPAAAVRDHYRASAGFVNAAPVPSFSVSRTGLAVAVDGTGSTDDGTISSYAWNFGDGSSATQGSASHTYAAAGTYTVTLTVTDDLGDTATTSQQVTVREPLPAPTDHYATEVMSDAPLLYWRLDETSGTTAFDSTPGTHDGTYVGDVTRQVASPLAADNPAVGFGPEEFVSSTDRFNNPTVFSVEAWFRTAGTGGRILGFSSDAGARSAGYDRSIYVDETGHVGFGTWTGFANTVTSPNTYNDDAWHHVVATLGPTGRVLYVDGVAVASNTDPNAQDLVGYWKAGSDNIWNGSGAFDGVLDEVAVYPTVLSPERVAAHRAASSSVNTPPVASFTDTADGLTLAVDASASTDDTAVATYAWNFGDGTTGTGGTATHTYAAAGSYTVTLTVTDNEGLTGTATRTVSVAAPNQAPAAAFTTVVNDLAVTFDGSGSSDPDGAIATWAWDFGDGTTGTGVSPTHTYATAGVRTVTLTVTDQAGATATNTQQVTAVAPNAAPTAAFTAAVDGASVSLDGSASTDDGSIAAWAWNFGDGNGGTGRTVAHSYAAAGTYTVALTVTDDRGATGTTSQQVTVTAPPVQTAIASDGFGRSGSGWGS
uniref:PKD domain-containing protein n=1 Tax=Propioniciclava soli TaxID=2775081 RepID=UPI001E3E9149